jgi:hypothetical protein
MPPQNPRCRKIYGVERIRAAVSTVQEVSSVAEAAKWGLLGEGVS